MINFVIKAANWTKFLTILGYFSLIILNIIGFIFLFYQLKS